MLIYENNGNLSYNKIVAKEGLEKKFATISAEAINIRNGRFFNMEARRFGLKVSAREVQEYYEVLSGDKEGIRFFDFDKGRAYRVLWDFWECNNGNLVIDAKMINPVITELFVRSSIFANFRASNVLNLSKLFASEKEQLEIACILNMPNEIKKDILYKLYPEFACFYYEVLPVIELIETELYPIAEVKDLKTRTERLHISTAPIDEILNAETIATKNTEVLKLVRKI